MRKLFTLGFVLVSLWCAAQQATLKVLGKHNYTVEAQAYGVVFVLEENTDKCDPVLGFISLEEQLKHLRESLEVAGFGGSISPVVDYSPSQYRKKTYRIEEESQLVFESILADLTNKQAIIKKTYYNLPPHRLVDEDESAVSALIDAEEKAEVLAEQLGYKITRVLNVDDDTRGANTLFDLIDRDLDPERVKLMMELVERLSQNSTVSNESDSPSRSGAYSIWVTFEIMPE